MILEIRMVYSIMAESALSSILLLAYIGMFLLIIVSTWKVFTKANKPGWASLIPIYNLYVMLKIGDNSGWFLLLMFVPILNIYAIGKMHVGIAEAFGKGIGWGLGLWFLPFIFFPILGFGDATYRGDSGRIDGASGQPAV